MYNLIHDIVLKTHREEKVARANTAAIIVEQLADQSPPHELAEPSSTTTSSPTTPKKRKLIQTPGAIYDDGNIYIVGNPLETMKEIRCPKCGLPRLLHPAIGDTQTPDPTIQYCKRRPFVDKPNHDIYGQPFKQVGPVKNTRKSKAKGSLAVENQAEAGSSFESPAPSPPEAESKKKAPRNVAPDVQCQRCGQSQRVNYFASHLAKCMGIGGRASGRAAALKINGQATGSQGGSTPPISRRSTPLPPDKTSPQKRDAEELEDNEDDWADDSPKKKKPKVVTKKWKSGKITVNGKAVTKEPPGDIKDSRQAAAVKQEKKLEGVVSLEPREVSESSQTLSSP
jgi:hypothetical protein